MPDELLRWHWDPAVVILVSAAVGYIAAARRAVRWPMWRTAAWLAGVAALAIALTSGLDADAGRLLSVHMVQHVTLWLVAPPLLVVGAPVRLALRAGRRATRAALIPVLRSRTLAAATHPVVGWTAFVAVTVGTHLTGIYALALRHDTLHALEHAAYFWSAVLFWMPLAGAAPTRYRLGPLGALGYLMTAMPAMVVVGLVLSGPALRYPTYAAPGHAAEALADQHAAAAIMSLTGVTGMTAAALVCVGAALAHEERAQRVRDQRAPIQRVAVR